MASTISDTKNPFLKDYSTSSILKKNYDVLLINSQVKQVNDDQLKFNKKFNQQKYNLQYKNQKQNISTSSSISNNLSNNPFNKKSINAFQLLNQRKNIYDFKSNNDLGNSQIRSLSQNRNYFGSLQKNTFYKGLQNIGTKQIWKNEMQKQARNQLKYFGPQTLRYQYVPTSKYTPSYSQQKPISYGSSKKLITKFDDQFNKQTPTWKNNITSEYYGYDQFKYDQPKQTKQQDDFPIQRATNKKSSLKKPSSSYDKQKPQKHSYFQDIPQDRNQDFQTAHNLKMKKTFEQNDFAKSVQSNFGHKRISIQNYHPQSSASSGFGTPSQMYQSGANFRAKFGANKNGPLNTQAFDRKSQQEQYGLDAFDDIKYEKHPQTLEYNNKIYYQVHF